MKIITQLNNYFKQKYRQYYIYYRYQNLDEVLLADRLHLLNNIASPQLANIGLPHWNGKYLWYSDFNEQGIQHIVQYSVGKGYSGLLTFGNAYRFIPSYSGNTLRYHRTAKTTKLMYLNHTPHWYGYMEGKKIVNSDEISTVNKASFQKTLTKNLRRNIPIIKEWFDNHQSIDQNIASLHQNLQKPPFRIGTPLLSEEYLLAFLYHQQHNEQETAKWIQAHFSKNLNSQHQKELLLRYLQIDLQKTTRSLTDT